MKISLQIKKALLRKRNLLLLLWPLSYGILMMARHSTAFTENFFVKWLFRPLSYLLGSLFSLFPFSVAEISIILAPFLVITLLVIFIVRLIRTKGAKLFVIITFLLQCVILGGVVYSFYVFGCGANYSRVSVAEQMELEVRASSKEELKELLVRLIDMTNELREGEEKALLEDKDGVYMLSISKKQMAKEIREEYKELKKTDTGLYFAGPDVRPKGVLFSYQMSKTEMTGLYTCWTMEANVNIDVPDYSIYSTMAHELSHLNGFIRENEANFLSFLTGLYSDNPEIRYSCFMEALIHTMNAYYSADPEHYFDVVAPMCNGVRRDLTANSEYWKQFEDTVISNTVENANNSYLQGNQVESGTKSYGEVVDLLLAYYRKVKF